MRILYVTQVPLDGSFGATRHVLAIVAELAARGHELCLLAPGAATVPGVKRIRPPRFLSPGVRMETALAGIATRLRVTFRPDVALVRISATSSLVPLTLRGLGIPVVLELNGRILVELEKRGRSAAEVSLVRTSLLAVVRACQEVIAVSDDVGDHALDVLGAREVAIIYNGADLAAAAPGDRIAARKRLELPTELKLLTMVGSLPPELRLDLFAEGFRRLSGTGFLVVGDGPQAQFIHAIQMSSRPSCPVIFLGARPHADAIDAIRAADVCINLRDGDIGMRGLEYAAVGRRQVAFAVRGSERFLSLYPPDLRAVHLVGERSGRALGDALVTAFDAERTLGPLPDAAVTEARKTLGWDHTAAQVEAVLEAHL